MAEREILRDYVASLADLMVVTSQLTLKQVKLTKKVEGSVSRFRKASSTPDFWSKALKELRPAQIGNLFFAISRIQEVFAGLVGFSNLNKEQQDEVLTMLKQVTASLIELKASL